MAAKKKTVKTEAKTVTEDSIFRVRTAPGVTSFRRAGHAFGQKPVDIAAADLDEEQREALLGEPRLKVGVLDKPAEPKE